LLYNSVFSNGGLRTAATVLAVAGAIALVGCNRKEETHAVGQVIAHVGPDDVTQPELDNEFRLARIPPDKRSDQVVKAILSRIAERKYLVQQAIAAKIDREPTVSLDLMRSREQILAGAFIQHELGGKITGISEKEIDAYIQNHPDRFANRKIFQIEQVTFPPQNDMESLAKATKDFKTMDQVEAKLKDLGVKYSRGPATLDGATLPPEMLKPLEARKPDDIFFIRSRTGASFFKVISADTVPLTGEQANAFAKREIASEMARKEAEETATAALQATKFEGDYARIMKTATPAAPTAGETSEGEGQSAEKPAGEASSPAEEATKPAEEQKNAPKN
jgi:EpsD family peptidyl-prolyl cis-trans isomerase